VWGGGFLERAGLLDFAGGTVVHITAGVAGLVAALVVGKRLGYGKDNFAPYDISMTVAGAGRPRKNPRQMALGHSNGQAV